MRSSPARKRVLILLGIATVAFTVILELIDPSHVSHGSTILAFEFARSRSRAALIISEWGPEGRNTAHLSLVLDYGYMLSYGLFFMLAGFAIHDTARRRSWRRTAAAGAVIPFFAIGAAMFDAIENVALLLTLGGHGGSFAPPFAAACSAIKFTLIGIAIVYVACGLALRARTRARGAANRRSSLPGAHRPDGRLIPLVSQTTLDWRAWHEDYADPDSALRRRLAIVQEQVRAALDRCAPGLVRAISVCAGQGPADRAARPSRLSQQQA